MFQLRKTCSFKNGKDFLMVGAMGHTSMVALSISEAPKILLFVWMEMVLS